MLNHVFLGAPILLDQHAYFGHVMNATASNFTNLLLLGSMPVAYEVFCLFVLLQGYGQIEMSSTII